MSELQSFDLLLGLLFLIFFARGLVRGFVRSFAAYAALFVGIYFAFHSPSFFSALLPHYRPFLHPILVLGIQMLVGFVLGMSLVLLLGLGLSKLIHLTPLGILDRILGGIFGVIKFGIILALLLPVLGIVRNYGQLPSWLNDSRIILWASSQRQLSLSWTYSIFSKPWKQK